MNDPLQSPPVWITGAAGLIGRYIAEAAPRSVPGTRAVGITRADLDLEDLAAVEKAFRRDTPSGIIHCAALSRSPDCQADPARARRINVEATAFLAGLATASSARLLFLSTDLVFDGRKGGYRESDAVNPLSVYAETKAEAELVVLRDPRHLVLRTSLNGGRSLSGSRGFNEELRRAWAEHRETTLFTDEFRCPLAAVVTARAVWELLACAPGGIVHLAGAERLSRWEIGVLIARRHPGLAAQLRPASLKSYHGAPRAPDTSLCCDKASGLLTFPLPGLGAWLDANPDVDF